MLFSLGRLSKMQLFACGLILLLAVAGLAVSKRKWRPTASVASAIPPPVTVLAQATKDKDKLLQRRIGAQLITLQGNGFEPSEIQREAGPFFLAINNRSGVDDAQFQLDSIEGGQRKGLLAKAVPKSVKTWHQVVDLPKGTYVLSEANHPKWTCIITVTK